MNKSQRILCLIALFTGSASLAMNSDNYGHIMLFGAASLGQLERAKELLDIGIPVDAKNFNGTTPLMFAALQGRNEMCQWLIDCKAQIDAKDNRGMTPIAHAVYSRKETCQLLVDIMIKPVKQNRAAAVALLGMRRFRNVACMNQLDKNIIRLIAHQLIVPAKEKLFEQIDSIKSEDAMRYFRK